MRNSSNVAPTSLSSNEMRAEKRRHDRGLSKAVSRSSRPNLALVSDQGSELGKLEKQLKALDAAKEKNAASFDRQAGKADGTQRRAR